MKKNSLKIATIIISSVLFFFIKSQAFPSMPEIFERWLGIIIAIIALVYLISEIRGKLPYFYGKSQSAGSNANGALVAGISLGILSTSLSELLVFNGIAIVLIAIILIVSNNESTTKSGN